MAQLWEDEFNMIVTRAIRRTADEVAEEMSRQIWEASEHGYRTGALAESVKVDHPAPWIYTIKPLARNDKYLYGKYMNSGRYAMSKTGKNLAGKPKVFVFTGKDKEKVFTKRVRGTMGKGKDERRGMNFVRKTYNKFV